MLETDVIIRGLGDKGTFFKILKGTSVSFQDYQNLLILAKHHLFLPESFETVVHATYLHVPDLFSLLKSEASFQNANVPPPLPSPSPSYLPSYLPVLLLLSQTPVQACASSEKPPMVP